MVDSFEVQLFKLQQSNVDKQVCIITLFFLTFNQVELNSQIDRILKCLGGVRNEQRVIHALQRYPILILFKFYLTFQSPSIAFFPTIFQRERASMGRYASKSHE